MNDTPIDLIIANEDASILTAAAVTDGLIIDADSAELTQVATNSSAIVGVDRDGPPYRISESTRWAAIAEAEDVARSAAN